MAVDTSSLAGTDNKKGYPKDQDIEEFASKEEVACPSRERERGGGGAAKDSARAQDNHQRRLLYT